MDSLDLTDATLASQAAAAGYADPGQYLQSLVEQDAERLAIEEGLLNVAPPMS